MICVYILKLSNNKYYTGITKDINRRLKEHINGQSKSTKHNLPIALVFLTTCYNRFDARRLEVKIKNQGARKFMIMNKFESIYSDISKFPDMLRHIIKRTFKATTINNEHHITFPEYVL